MTHARTLALLAAAILSAGAAAVAQPLSPNIRVRQHLVPAADFGQLLSGSEELEIVPLRELDRLIANHRRLLVEAKRDREAARAREARRLPIPALIREASLTASVTPDSGWCQARLRATVELTAAGRHALPILAGDVVAGSATVDGDLAELTAYGAGGAGQHDLSQQQFQQPPNSQAGIGQAATPPGRGPLAVMLQGAGRHDVEVRFAAKIGEDGFYKVIRFGLPGLPSCRFTMTVPGKDVVASVQPPSAIAVSAGETAGTAALDTLLTPSPDVTFRWVEVTDAPVSRDEKSAPPATAATARIDATALHLYDAGEKGITGHFSAWLRARRAPVSSLVVEVPSGVQALTLAEPRGWTLEDPGPAGAARRVRVLAPEKWTGDVLMRVEFAVDIKSSGFAVELPSLGIAGLARQPGFVAVTRSANLELTCTAPAGVEPLSADDLPDTVKPALAGRETLFLYRRPDSTRAVKLAGRRYPDAPVLAALVDQARAWTLVDLSGEIAGRIAYRFRSRGRDALVLDLSGYEQIGLYLNGKTPAASARDGGKIHVSLAGVRPGESATLEVRFRGASPPLGASGSARYVLPALDVPIRELGWELYTPREVTLTDFEGESGLRRGAVAQLERPRPPDQPWPARPASLMALGLPGGATPGVRCLYLGSPLSLYPLLMLLLFGGFVGHVGKRVLLDGRGFALAAFATALGLFLWEAYVPAYPGTVDATFAGLVTYLAVLIATASGRWLARRRTAPTPTHTSTPAPVAATIAALLAAVLASPGHAGDGGTGGFLSGLLSRARSAVHEDEQAKQVEYLKGKLMRNKQNLENQRRQNNAPAQQQEGAQDAVEVENGLAPAAAERAMPMPSSAPQPSIAVEKSIAASPPLEIVDAIVPFAGSSAAPKPAARALVKRALLERLRHTPGSVADPIAPAVRLLDAAYRVRLERGRALASLALGFETTGTGWKELALAVAPAAVTGWRVEPAPGTPPASPALLERRDGQVVVRLDGEGRHSVTVDLASTVSGSHQEGSLSLGQAPACLTRCVMTGGAPGSEVVVSGPSWETEAGREIWFAPGAPLKVAWRPKTVLPGSLAVAPADEPERMTAESFTVLTVESGFQALRCRAQLGISDAGTRLITFRLPRGFDFLEAKTGAGEPLADVAPQPDGRIVVRLPERVRGSYLLDVWAERAAVVPDGGELGLEAPSFPGAERESGFLAAATEPLTELRSVDEKGLAPADARELPAFARLASSQRQTILRSFQRPGYLFRLALVRRSRVETALLDASRARARTLLTGSGQALTSITYQVTNSREQFLRVSLPEGASLEAVTVGGRPVKPATGAAAGELLIPLPPSARGPEGLLEIPIDVVYSEPSEPLSRFSRWTGQVPRAAVNVQGLVWTVHLPEEYRFHRSGGEFHETGFDYESPDAWRELADRASSSDAEEESPGPVDEIRAAAPHAKAGVHGIAAPVPATGNGRSFSVELIRPDGPAPRLELTAVHESLASILSSAVLLLSVLALPWLVLAPSTALKLLGVALLLLAGGLAAFGSTVAGGGISSVVEGLGQGILFLIVYGIFRPIRGWRARRLAAAALLLLLVSVAPAECSTPGTPAATRAAETILVPYSEDGLAGAVEAPASRGFFPLALLRRAEEASAPPAGTATPASPVGAVLAEGTLTGDITGATGLFRLDASVDVLEPGYHTVPLLEGEFAVVRFEGDGILDVRGADDYLQQEINQGDAILDGLSKGRQKIQVLTARLSTRVVVEGKGRKRLSLSILKREPFAFVLPRMTGCAATIRFDRAGVVAELPGAVQQKVQSGEGRTVLTAEVTPGAEFRLAGYEAAPGEAPGDPPPVAPAVTPDASGESLDGAPAPPAAPTAPPPPEREPHASVSCRTDLSIGESLVKGFAIVDCEIRRARLPKLELDFPAGVRIDKIQGPGGKPVPVGRLTPGTNGRQTLTLQPPAGMSKTLQWTVHFEKTLAEGEASFDVPIPHTRGVAFESGHVTVQRDGPVGLSAESLTGIEEIAPDRLPFATTPATALAYRYRGSDARLRFRVNRHVEARLATVAIDSSVFHSRIAASGATSSKLELMVRRSSGQYLEIKLPAGVRLTRARRDDRPVDATGGADGALLIPLDIEKGPDSPASKISLEYTGTGVELSASGSFEVPFPVTGVPVTGAGAHWQLAGPASHVLFPDAGPGKGLLGLFARAAPTSGRAYLLGPGAQTRVQVRYLSKVPAMAVFTAEQLLSAIAGAAIVAILDASLPGGAALGVLLLVFATALLALLTSVYAFGFPGIVSLGFGILAAGMLAVGWRIGLKWRRRIAGAAIVVLTALPAGAAEPAAAAQFHYLRSAEAVRAVTQGAESLLTTRERMEELLRQIEVPREQEDSREPVPPADVFAQDSETAVTIESADAAVTAVHRYYLATDAVRAVPLGNPGSIVSVDVDGSPADLSASYPAETLAAYLRGKGPHRVTIRFRVPVTRVQDAGWLQWEQPQMPVNRVTVTLPGTGRGVEVVPSLATEVREESQTTRAAATVRMAGNVFVRWFEKGEKTADAPKPREEARVEAELATRFHLFEDRADGRTTLRYRVAKGAIAGLTVALPAGTAVLEVSGAPVKHWKQEAAGGRELEILFDHFRSDSETVTIEHARALAAPAGAIATRWSVDLAAPSLPAAATVAHTVGVRADEGLDLRELASPDWRAIDPAELPDTLAAGDIPLAFRAAGAAGPIRLEVERVRGLETPSFDVSRMRLELLPGADRWLETRMLLSVRNNSRQHLEVQLPPGAVPVDCRVQGEPRRPGLAGDGLLIPLVRSTGDADNLEPFPVDLTFLSQTGPPDATAGWWDVQLPRLPQFRVDRLEVAISAPLELDLSLWSTGMDRSGQPLPADQAARALESLARKFVLAPRFYSRALERKGQMMTQSIAYPAAAGPANVSSEYDGAANGKEAEKSGRHRRESSVGKKRPAMPARFRALQQRLAKRGRASGARSKDDALAPGSSAATNELSLQEPASPSLGQASHRGGEGFGLDSDEPAAAPEAPAPLESIADDKNVDAYQTLQRSLGDRGALPVGIKNEVHDTSKLAFEGSLYPAGATPARITLLVYAPSVRLLAGAGLALLSFFLAVLTLGWAVGAAWRMPFFLVITLLPIAGFVLEWQFGAAMVPWIVTGIAAGFVGTAARMLRARRTAA